MSQVYCVTIKSGCSFEHLAVHAVNAHGAELVVRDAGYILTGATTYAIDTYGAKFCKPFQYIDSPVPAATGRKAGATATPDGATPAPGLSLDDATCFHFISGNTNPDHSLCGLAWDNYGSGPSTADGTRNPQAVTCPACLALLAAGA